MTLGGILEFFLGNTFSFVVFCSFGPFILMVGTNARHKLMLPGGFWFTLGSTLTPGFNAFSTYSGDNYGGGLQSPGFHAAFGSSPVSSHNSWLTKLSFLPSRILLTLYGSPELDISHLRIEDKPGLRCHLPGPVHDVCLTGCFVLAPCNRAP